MVPTYLAGWHPEASAVTRSALRRDYCMPADSSLKAKHAVQAGNAQLTAVAII